MKQRFRRFSSDSVGRAGVFTDGSGYQGGMGVVEHSKGSTSASARDQLSLSFKV